jgi:excinuclease ABC subunit A
VDKGNTIIVIEHNLDVIKVADHIIDVGPEGGSGGGKIIAEGKPADIVKKGIGYTAEYLKELLTN